MIGEKIANIKNTLAEGCRLVAVSKTKPVEDIMEAYNAGQRLFGENYATELRDKAAVLPKDIEWHFIGHLQSKQLKYYIGFVSMIHGVDSVEHLEDVEHAAAKAGRVVNVLLQVHVAKEETKFGFLPEELMAADFDLSACPHVRVCGLMAMASNTPDVERVRADFREAKCLFDTLKAGRFANHPEFRELSMGMSHDYMLAVEEGSTLVRIGSSIFGARDYSKKQ
jgi:pyridoxal phosphate enzyme (YggS family)